MELLKLTPKEFTQIAKLIYERTGIHLPESKRTLMSNRLRKRLRTLGLDSFDDYYSLLCDPHRCDEELPHFLSAVTTNETCFFRNQNLWRFFREMWLPAIVERKKRTRSIRIWSAASSSGEEAYTAAICLREHFPEFGRWRVSVVGSDISQRMLERARRGEYNDYAIAKVAEPLLKKWFIRTGDLYHIEPEIRKVVSFQFHNLRDPFPRASFDLVFLRNVMMYFDATMKQRVLANVTEALVPGGQLLVGDVDPIRKTAELSDGVTLEYCGPNVHRKPERATASVTAGS